MTNKYPAKCLCCDCELPPGSAAGVVKYGSAWDAICPACTTASGVTAYRAVHAFYDGNADEPSRADLAIRARMDDRLHPCPADAWDERAWWPLGDPQHRSGGDVAALACYSADGALIGFTRAPEAPSDLPVFLAAAQSRGVAEVAPANTDDGYTTPACTYVTGPRLSVAQVEEAQPDGRCIALTGERQPADRT